MKKFTLAAAALGLAFGLGTMGASAQTPPVAPDQHVSKPTSGGGMASMPMMAKPMMKKKHHRKHKKMMHKKKMM